MPRNSVARHAESATDFVDLTTEPLDVAAISGTVGSDSAGAISLFVGTTRDNFDNKSVVRLEYEAYAPMAVKELKSLCCKVRAGWPEVIKIAIQHRLGVVPVGEASVVIGVSSPHRRVAMGTLFRGSNLSMQHRQIFSLFLTTPSSSSCSSFVRKTVYIVLTERRLLVVMSWCGGCRAVFLLNFVIHATQKHASMRYPS